MNPTNESPEDDFEELFMRLEDGVTYFEGRTDGEWISSLETVDLSKHC